MSTLTTNTGLGTWLENTLKRAGVDPTKIEGLSNAQLLDLPGVDSQVLAAIRMIVPAPNGVAFPGPIEDEQPAKRSQVKASVAPVVTVEAAPETTVSPVPPARPTPRIDPKVLWAPRRGRLPTWLIQARAEAIARGEGPTSGQPTPRRQPTHSAQVIIRPSTPRPETEPEPQPEPQPAPEPQPEPQPEPVPVAVQRLTAPHVNVTRLPSGGLRGICPECGSITVWNTTRGEPEPECAFCARNLRG